MALAYKLLGRCMMNSVCAIQNRGISLAHSPICVQVTTPLFGEPLKKKKRLDPNILRAREEKRKRKLEKEIRRLEKVAHKYKPIDECEVSPKLSKELKIRTRPAVKLTEEELEMRSDLEKEWSRYKYEQHLFEERMIQRLIDVQDRALIELKKESVELFQEAVQMDPSFIPFKVNGPVNTPPIENYKAPDGDYIDITRKWV